MVNTDFKAKLKKVVEISMPDLRKYYRVVRKGKIVKSYDSNGQYFADVQPLRNDESVDDNEPVIPNVEIPIIWGGANRGVVCPPEPGTFCDIDYYDGDPNYPRISNFRWHGNGAPECSQNEFIIQLEPGVSIKIDSGKNITLLTSENIISDAGTAWTVTAGDTATVRAPIINLETETGNIAGIVTGACICQFTGNPHSDCSATVMGDK